MNLLLKPDFNILKIFIFFISFRGKTNPVMVTELQLPEILVTI